MRGFIVALVGFILFVGLLVVSIAGGSAVLAAFGIFCLGPVEFIAIGWTAHRAFAGRRLMIINEFDFQGEPAAARRGVFMHTRKSPTGSEAQL